MLALQSSSATQLAATFKQRLLSTLCAIRSSALMLSMSMARKFAVTGELRLQPEPQRNQQIPSKSLPLSLHAARDQKLQRASVQVAYTIGY